MVTPKQSQFWAFADAGQQNITRPPFPIGMASSFSSHKHFHLGPPHWLSRYPHPFPFQFIFSSEDKSYKILLSCSHESSTENCHPVDVAIVQVFCLQQKGDLVYYNTVQLTWTKASHYFLNQVGPTVCQA